MCLQLPLLTADINIEIAPKKENWIAQLRYRMYHMCMHCWSR